MIPEFLRNLSSDLWQGALVRNLTEKTGAEWFGCDIIAEAADDAAEVLRAFGNQDVVVVTASRGRVVVSMVAFGTVVKFYAQSIVKNDSGRYQSLDELLSQGWVRRGAFLGEGQ